MKFAIEQKRFAQAVSTAYRAVNPRLTLGLAGIKIAALEDEGPVGILLEATDLTISIATKAASLIDEPGEVVVPGRLLHDFVTALPPDQVAARLEGSRLYLECGQHKAELATIRQEEFPGMLSVERGSTFGLDRASLVEALSRVAFAVVPEDTRPAMSGVLFDVGDNGITFVAADGFRLAKSHQEAQIGGQVSPEEPNIIVPGKAVAELIRLLRDTDADEVTTFVGKNNIEFACGPHNFTSALVAARYPDYEAIIPKGWETRIVVDTRDLIKAVRVASLFARDAANIVRLGVSGGTVTVTGSASEVGGSETAIYATVSGPEMQIAFNAGYLLDALASIDTSEVVLALTAKNRPGVIMPDDGTSQVNVVMPMQCD